MEDVYEIDELMLLEQLGEIGKTATYIIYKSQEWFRTVRWYRLPKELVKYLLTRFGDKLSYGSDHNNCLSPIEQLLLALRFYATGSFQIVIGDLGKVSQPSACRAIQRVSVLIAKLLPEYVSLPKTEEERQEVDLVYII